MAVIRVRPPVTRDQQPEPAPIGPLYRPNPTQRLKSTLCSAGLTVGGGIGTALLLCLKFLLLPSKLLLNHLLHKKPTFELHSISEQYEENGFAVVNALLDLLHNNPQKADELLTQFAREWKKNSALHLTTDTQGTKKCIEMGNDNYHLFMQDSEYRKQVAVLLDPPPWREVHQPNPMTAQVAKKAMEKREAWDLFANKWIVHFFKETNLFPEIKMVNKAPSFGKLLEKIVLLGKLPYLKSERTFNWLANVLEKEVLPPLIKDLRNEKGEDFIQLKIVLEKLQRLLSNERKRDKLHEIVSGMVAIYEGNHGASV